MQQRRGRRNRKEPGPPNQAFSSPTELESSVKRHDPEFCKNKEAPCKEQPIGSIAGEAQYLDQLKNSLKDEGVASLVVTDPTKLFRLEDGTLIYGDLKGTYVVSEPIPDSDPTLKPHLSLAQSGGKPWYHGSRQENFKKTFLPHIILEELVAMDAANTRCLIAKLMEDPNALDEVTQNPFEKFTCQLLNKYVRQDTTRFLESLKRKGSEDGDLIKHAFAYAAREFLAFSHGVEKQSPKVKAALFLAFILYVRPGSRIPQFISVEKRSHGADM